MTVTRFAPSPTGHLHLGHAFSALFAERAAEGGAFILRIEDIDPVRCRPEFTDAIIEDLRWLGLKWREPVRLQSQHMEDYKSAFDHLRGQGLLYPCFCTRQDIDQAVHAPHAEDGASVYPGTCRHLPEKIRSIKLSRGAANWRLDLAAALKRTGPLFWHDRQKGKIEAKPEILGDVVLTRKDVPTSYHLSVSVDDHKQGVTLVTRGEDLFTSTHIHRLLQALLGLDVPEYSHHALMTDASGRRYAKRDQSVTLRSLRESGETAGAVMKMIGMN